MVSVVFMNVIPLFCCQLYYNYMELPYHEYIKKTQMEQYIPFWNVSNDGKTVRFIYLLIFFIINLLIFKLYL
jgi:hypothetical protein